MSEKSTKTLKYLLESSLYNGVDVVLFYNTQSGDTAINKRIGKCGQSSAMKNMEKENGEAVENRCQGA